MRAMMESLRKRISQSPGYDSRNMQLILNVVLIIVINIAAAAFSFRIDLTTGGTYSLSERSREVVSGLNEKLKIKVFFSENLPAEHAAVYRYLTDLLEEYDFYGNRNFSYEIIKEPELEEQAGDFGIEPVKSREFSEDQVKLRSVYMGVVIQHADLVEKIDSLTSASGLEFEITSRIEKMTAKIDRLLKLEKPLMLTLFLDRRVTELPIDGIGKLENILSEAAGRSSARNYGKIEFRIIDPSVKGSGELDKNYGITRLRWGAMKSRNGKGISAGEGYFGLLLEGNGRAIRIPLDIATTVVGTNVITGLQNIEDTINSGVSELLGASQRVGYVIGHGIPDLYDMKSPEGAGYFAGILSDIYQLVPVDVAAGDIPADIPVLIVNGPTDNFSEIEKYRIDRFLMEGKSLLYFANRFIEVDTGANGGFPGRQQLVVPVTTGLEEMAGHYGVRVDGGIVLDRDCARINLGEMLTDYPLIPMIGRKGLNSDSPATRYIRSALFIKTSPVEITLKPDMKNIRGEILVSTSERSWLMEGRMDFSPFMMNQPDPSQLRSYPVAVMLEGSFRSFFEGKTLPAGAEKSGRGSALKRESRLDSTVSSGSSRLVVVGTSDINSSGFINSARRILSDGNPSGAYSNDILIHSMVDMLAGNSHVPEMKSKSLSYNPLERTGARTRFLLKIINMGFLPVFVVLTGVIVWRRRALRKKHIENLFSGRTE